MSMQRTDSRMMREPVPKSRTVQWTDQRLPIFTFLQHELDEYPTPNNLNYLLGKDRLI